MKKTVKLPAAEAFIIYVDNCYHPGTFYVPEDGYLADYYNENYTTPKKHLALAFPSKATAEEYLLIQYGATKCAEPYADTYCNFDCNHLYYGQYSRPEYNIEKYSQK